MMRSIAARSSNLQMLLILQNERMVHGELLTVENNLLPSLTAKGALEAQQIDLAALGFKAGIAGGVRHRARDISNDCEGEYCFGADQHGPAAVQCAGVLSVPSAQKAAAAANYSTLNVRGGVTLAVGTQYLLALADAAQIENARALEKADEVAYRQAKDSHDAGVGTNLDVLRARVQLQTQQQAVISTENAFAKDKIALNRLIGLPADQEITLTDTAPYAEFAEMPLAGREAPRVSAAEGPAESEAQLEVASAGTQGGEVGEAADARLQRILRRDR